MAGSEVYRVEIPIIVDDQTDKPLQQAEQKISKLEQHARKENERIRQHFMKIAKLQIEPIMRVRDHLTSGVLKADRLIRKLDMAQASPLIAAQDRVSAVVTRTNAMLDALDKGKVDVIADMKGPLLDEIVKAKSALAVLNNVKAGPVAELRGELFGQLTKAMSQIRGLDLSRAEPQATLRERVTMKVREIGSSLRSLTARAWDITLQVKDKATGVIRSVAGSVRGIIDKLTSPLALLGAGAGLGAGIFFPLKLAGEFEQAQMSLDFYMGSVEEGKRAFQDLIRFAKETPFEFPFLQGATIQLMGAGYNFEQAKRALLAFGDAAGRTGAGMQGIEAALLGFTQIASAGTLNLQDLKQVALNLKLPLNIFAKELGVAESELGDIGRAGISSQKAMEAIVKTLEQRFKGGMKELSNSLLGMTAVIKDTAQLTVWHFGKGMAEPVKRIMFDIIGLTEDTGGAFEEFQRRLERVGEQVGLKFEQVYSRIKGFWNNLSADPAFQKLDFGDKIIYVLNLALDEVSAWLDSEGGMKLQETFTKLGEIGAKAWIAGLKGAFKGAVSSAAHGNLVGAGAMLGLASMLGGGLVLRGAWGLGKGLFGAGKWALGKLGLGSAGATAAGVAAETAATAGGVGIAGRVLPILGRARPWLGRIGLPIAAGLEAINIARAEDKRTAVISGAGRIAGMIAGGKAGAMAGGAVGGLFGGVGAAPGAVIGGILGGIGGLFGGQALADRVNEWIDGIDFGRLKTRAIKTWEEVKESASSAWNWIKENFTLESIAEKAGYVVSYLESTIFSSEWWLEKWENVKVWAADKWATMSEVWENTKEILNSTIFSSEWWLEKWGNVKSWTSEKWDEMKTVWETVKSNISSTLFSKTWWESKWESVKNWASNALSGIVSRWESIKESFQAGREAGQRAAATKHAIGGILTRPHLGLVAETGPEAIIPLSVGMRSRALGLWEEAGRRLGVSAAIPAPAEQMFGERRAVTPAGEPLFPGTELRAMPKRAIGGIFSRPHTALVAEAGPEAIIPLSARMRPRALELWQQTGELLGVMLHASGGIFGNVLGGIKNVWNKTKMLFKSDRVSSIANTTESAAIALESTRKGQELTTRSIQIMGSSDKRQAIIKELGSILGAIGTGALVSAGIGVLVGAGVMSPVTAMLGAILGAGAGAFGGQAAASALYDRFSPHATGGILTRPHLGLVAEAGPEAIIPLSARMRSRALALYEETGRRLGVRPYAEGGFAGSVPVAVGASGVSSAVTIGSVEINFDISANDGQDVLQAIRANYKTIANEITNIIADGLGSVYHNTPAKR